MSEKHWSLAKYSLVRQTYGVCGAIQRYLMSHHVLGEDIIFFISELDYAYQGINRVPDYIILHNIQKFLSFEYQEQH